jgi:Zinc knuckle
MLRRTWRSDTIPENRGSARRIRREESEIPRRFKDDLRGGYEDPVLVMPADIADTATKRELVIWEASLKSYARRQEELKSNLTTLYAVIWGQCSNAMRNKLRALDDFVSENQKNNCIWLLKEIKGVTHKFDTKRHVVMSLLDARVAFYNCHQTQNQTNADYLATFQSNVHVLEYYKATVGENYIHADASKSVTERTKIMRDSTIAIMFIRNSDPRRYGTLLSDLANQHTRGNDQYPSDITAAYSLLVNYHPPAPTTRPPSNPQVQNTATANSNTNVNANSGTNKGAIVPSNIGPHTFAQAASPARHTTTGCIVPGSDGTTVGNITCFSCNANGHYATNCPSAISLVQYAYVLTQSADGPEYACKSISKDWILLDSQSSISVFNNPLMLTNIRESPQPVIVKTNGGCHISSQIGDF